MFKTVIIKDFGSTYFKVASALSYATITTKIMESFHKP